MGGVVHAVTNAAQAVAKPVDHAISVIPVVGKPLADASKIGAGLAVGNVSLAKEGLTSSTADVTAITGSSANTALLGNVAGAAVGDPLAGSQLVGLVGSTPSAPAPRPIVTTAPNFVGASTALPGAPANPSDQTLIFAGIAALGIGAILLHRRK